MRKTFLLIVVIALVLIVGIGIVFLRAVPESDARLLSENPRLLSGLRLVPAGADAIVLAPSAKGLLRALKGNKVTATAVTDWETKSELRALRLVPGELDLIAWRLEDKLFFAIACSPMQRSLIRTGSRFNSDAPAFRSDGEWLTTAPRVTEPSAWSELKSMAEGRTGKLFFYLTPRERNFLASPGKPAFVAVDLKPDVVTVRSSSRNSPVVPSDESHSFAFPRSALLSMRLQKAPQVLAEIEKLTRVKLSNLIAAGGMLSVYKVDDRKAIPRLQGVIVISADQQKAVELAAVVENLAPSVGGTLGRLLGGARRRSERSGPEGTAVVRVESVGYTVEHAYTERELIVSLDKSSMDLYLIDRKGAPPSPPEVQWTLRLEEAELRRIAKVGENDALRLFAPEVSNRIQELTRISSLIPEGCLLEATSTTAEAYDEILATVTAK